MRGPARSGNDHLDAPLLRRGEVFHQRVGGAVGGDRLGFPRDAEVVEFLRGVGHHAPIRLAPHQDADQRFLNFCCHKKIKLNASTGDE